MNTYRYFGRRSFCIGSTDASQGSSRHGVDRVFLPGSEQYQKLVYRGDRLVGVSCINSSLDPGIMVEIIRRQIDLGSLRKSFSSAPLETGRLLMAEIWGKFSEGVFIRLMKKRRFEHWKRLQKPSNSIQRSVTAVIDVWRNARSSNAAPRIPHVPGSRSHDAVIARASLQSFVISAVNPVAP